MKLIKVTNPDGTFSCINPKKIVLVSVEPSAKKVTVYFVNGSSAITCSNDKGLKQICKKLKVKL